MLTMVGAQRLDKEGVQAILNLVAAAVPGLRAHNIAIVDSRGDLLARAGQPTTQFTEAATAEEVRHTTELRLARAVEDMLEKTLGPGRVRAEASVRMNFDKVNETKEQFDPDQQVTRSTQTVNSTVEDDRGEPGGHRAEQPAERGRRRARQRVAGRPAGGDHQLRNRQDRPHADPRAAADRSHQPRGDG